MPLKDEAYLQIQDGTGTTATFQLSIGLEDSTEIEKTFIMARKGQYISEIADNEVVELGVDAVAQRRAGWWIDGGAGTVTFTIEFSTGPEDVTWGDGSGGTGQANLTKTDASGADVDPLDRKQVLEYWIRRTRTDSAFGQAGFHWGQWTDGSVGGASAGIYDEAIPVAILSSNIRMPLEEPSNLQGTLTMARIAIFPPNENSDFPPWVVDAANTIQDLVIAVRDG